MSTYEKMARYDRCTKIRFFSANDYDNCIVDIEPLVKRINTNRNAIVATVANDCGR